MLSSPALVKNKKLKKVKKSIDYINYLCYTIDTKVKNTKGELKMTNKELQSKLATIKNGTYFRIEWQSVKDNGYYKLSNSVVRNVSYSSVVGKENKKTTKQNPNDQYLQQNLILNKNSGKTRLQVFLTKHHKAHVKYFDNNHNEITKEEWLEANPKEKNKPTPNLMFAIFVENIIKVGN